MRTNAVGTAYGNEEQFTTQLFPGETVLVNGGTFDMGSNDGSSNEQPIHSVTLSSLPYQQDTR